MSRVGSFCKLLGVNFEVLAGFKLALNRVDFSKCSSNTMPRISSCSRLFFDTMSFEVSVPSGWLFFA